MQVALTQLGALWRAAGCGPPLSERALDMVVTLAEIIPLLVKPDPIVSMILG